MAKVSDSKAKTVAAAARLFCQQGYHGTALHDILEASGAPRGSLYFHFPNGKEEIGVAAVALGAQAVHDFIVQASAAAQSAEAFVASLARGMAANLERSGYREGCPIAPTALETATHSKALGAAARKAFQSWEREIRRGLERFGLKPAEAERSATAVLSLLEGALLLSRTYRSIEPMHRAEKAAVMLVGKRAG
ncbi:MAG: TetR/AcrR family transcriptional regulator, lmrAB and yxaGH operons repressor [Hyphomicrobiales bacterium]|jgi:TetR/AcrR family transcriptional repressor of lmrAB and yxaGH operons|nr:TetR/AcrR family transcriptional regulator, lmrAB and yxaGH operons repressor [Hyphomicrobiales bacterium]